MKWWLLVLLPVSSFAQLKPGEPPVACTEVVKKCAAEGYTEKEHLWVDCVAKRARDKKVEKVENVTAAEAQKCLDAVKAQYRH